MKTCTKCRETKPPDAFHKRRNTPDGLHERCKACLLLAAKERKAATDRAWYAANQERKAAATRAWAAANPERRAAINKACREAARSSESEALVEARRARDREYAKARYPETKAANLARRRLKRLNDPEFAERENAKLRAWNKANPDKKKAQKRRRERLLAGARQEFYAPRDIFERDGWRCYLCDMPVDREAVVPAPRSATIEHVIPISKGGADAPDNVKCAHFACNIRKRTAIVKVNSWETNVLFACNV